MDIEGRNHNQTTVDSYWHKEKATILMGVGLMAVALWFGPKIGRGLAGEVLSRCEDARGAVELHNAHVSPGDLLWRPSDACVELERTKPYEWGGILRKSLTVMLMEDDVKTVVCPDSGME